MQLSQKQKSLYEFFLEFLKFRFNFEHFQKKMALIASWLFAFKNIVFYSFSELQVQNTSVKLMLIQFHP